MNSRIKVTLKLCCTELNESGLSDSKDGLDLTECGGKEGEVRLEKDQRDEIPICPRKREIQGGDTGRVSTAVHSSPAQVQSSVRSRRGATVRIP